MNIEHQHANGLVSVRPRASARRQEKQNEDDPARAHHKSKQYLKVLYARARRTYDSQIHRPYRFLILVWIAFLARGSIHSVIAPVWDGFDEPFHLAYIIWIAENGRPPGVHEPSVPSEYFQLAIHLPTAIRLGEGTTFPEWKQLSPEDQARRRGEAASLRPVTETSAPNYERQQPPLFYYLSVPIAYLIRDLSLPAQLVMMRLWCVALASLMIPLAWRLNELVLPPPVRPLALFIAAGLPNTIFFADRVTNDALAWPIFTAICVLLVIVTTRNCSRKSCATLGVLLAVGVWTKLTLLPLVPAVAVAILLSRSLREGIPLKSRLALCAGIPVLLTAPLLIWNAVEIGHWSGLPYHVDTDPRVGDYLHAVVSGGLISPIKYWVWLHIWSGGWGFVLPSVSTYVAIIATLIALLITLGFAAFPRRTMFPFEEMRPLMLLAFFFGAAMFFHTLSFVAAAAKTPRFAGLGGEGWYFDLLRPIEAVLLGALFYLAWPQRIRVVTCLITMGLIIADLAGTLLLLLPRWGATGRRTPWQSLQNGLSAAPIEIPMSALLLLTALWIGSVILALNQALRTEQ